METNHQDTEGKYRVMLYQITHISMLNMVPLILPT